jgi:hypothetical protein
MANLTTLLSQPQFVYFTADEGVGELEFKDRSQAIDHFRYLIAERTGDRAKLKELRRLRGEPEGDADVEHAQWLIAIYQHIIEWLIVATPGESFKALGGGVYQLFCIGGMTLFDSTGKNPRWSEPQSAS